MEKTIDQLIKEAPNDDRWEQEPYFVEHKTYSLINTKEALCKFKKIRPYTPRKPVGRKITRRLNTRVTGDGICYKTPYIPRRVTKLPEYNFSEQYYGAYFQGFYTNNQLMVKMDRPKTRKPLQGGEAHQEEFLNAIPRMLLMHVNVKEETYTFMDEYPIPRAHFHGFMDVEVNAALLDVVYKYHPEHIARTDGTTVCFYVKDELVAAIACLKKL